MPQDEDEELASSNFSVNHQHALCDSKDRNLLMLAKLATHWEELASRTAR